MPLIKLDLPDSVTDEQVSEVLPAVSKLLADITGKPEKYVMATAGRANFLMAGKTGPAAFADVRGIGGLAPDVNKKFAAALCGLLKDTLRIPPDRVYITFADVPASNWGFNGGTFG